MFKNYELIKTLNLELTNKEIEENMKSEKIKKEGMIKKIFAFSQSSSSNNQNQHNLSELENLL